MLEDVLLYFVAILGEERGWTEAILPVDWQPLFADPLDLAAEIISMGGVPLVHLGESLGLKGVILLGLLGEEGEEVLGPTETTLIPSAFFHIITVMEL